MWSCALYQQVYTTPAICQNYHTPDLKDNIRQVLGAPVLLLTFISVNMYIKYCFIYGTAWRLVQKQH